MSDQTQPTTDSAGVARTETGEIAPTPTPAPAASSLTTTPPPSDPPKATDAAAPAAGEADKSLLNQKGAPVPEGAPETYSDYAVPEGFALDPAVKTEADRIFKSMNLSQAQAQELVNFYATKSKEAFEQPFNAYQDTRKEWRTQAENDPDLRGKLGPGGDVLTTIAKAIDSLADPKLASDFREAMDFTGAGDNPAFIKAFYYMAQRLTEGSHVAGRGPATPGQQRPGQPARSPATDLWPNLPSASRG